MDQEIKKLKQQIKDTTVIVGVKRRKEAARRLGEIGTPPCVIPLVEALMDEDNEVQRNAFLGLSSLTDPIAQEILRNLYLRDKNKALLQIIRKGKMYPEDPASKLSFFQYMKFKDEMSAMVNEENFSEIIDHVIQSEVDNKYEIINTILPNGGAQADMIIIKKFIDNRDETLFRIIDEQNWYPSKLNQKIMFLLKTEQYRKVIHLMDGSDFNEIVKIVFDEKFPMKNQLHECLSQMTNPILIDEICQTYMRLAEDDPSKQDYFAKMLIKHDWSPNAPKDKIFFYILTRYLNDILKQFNVEPKMLAGYLQIPEIKEKTNDSELIHLAYSLSTYANKRNADEEIEFEENENPVKEMGLKVKRYLESTKKPEVLRDICEAFVETNSDYLGYLIVEMGWEFGGISERIPMYLLSNQLTKVEQLGKEVVPVLYRILKKEQKNLKLKNAARNAIRKTTNQDLIDEYFEIYFKNSDPELEEIFKEQDWKNSEKSKTAVYFVMSGQSNRYSEIEPEGYKIILEAYNKMNFEKRYNLLENIIESKSERLIDFLLYLFTSETNPRILQLLSQAVNVFYEKTYHRVKAMIPKLDKPILRELSLALAKVKRERSSELLYKTALKEKGHMALWILKILDEIRWQPRDIKERAFFFELYNLRDAIFHMLEERLESNDMEIAVSAARTFAEIGDESILVTLMRMADEGQERLQKECAYTIGYICTINPEKSLNQIQHYRRNSIYITYNDVRKAFHASNDKEQMLILKGYFEKGNKVLRSFAAAVISNIKKMESIPLLHLMMEDTDPFVRYLAIKGMNTLSVAENARYLFEEISADDDRNRMLAAEAYAKVGKEKYFEKFQQKLQTGEATYPDSLIHILSLRKGEDAKDTFERVLTHPAYGPTAKTEAIKALARIGGEKLEYKLITDAKKVAETYNRPTEVLPYIDAMEIIGGTKVYRALEAIFENGNWEMRRNVIRVLGNIPHRICMVTIIKALDDSNAWVQLQALESLNKFYNSHFKFEDNEKDLKLIAAVIMRLKKFELNDLIDKEFPVYKIFTELDIMIFRHQLTMFYAEKKRILTGKEVHFKKIAERRDYRELVREAMVSRKGAPIPSMVTATAGEAITTPTTGDTTAEETETIVVKTEVQKKEKILRKIKKPLVKKSKIVGGKVKKTALSKLKKKE